MDLLRPPEKKNSAHTVIEIGLDEERAWNICRRWKVDVDAVFEYFGWA